MNQNFFLRTDAPITEDTGGTITGGGVTNQIRVGCVISAAEVGTPDSLPTLDSPIFPDVTPDEVVTADIADSDNIVVTSRVNSAQSTIRIQQGDGGVGTNFVLNSPIFIATI